MNSVNNLFDSVQYVYPGRGCEPETYAYIIQGSPETYNSKGQPLVYLCDDYMEAKVSVQVETLTHEASHHAVASTDDVCMDEFHKKSAHPVYIEELLSELPSGVKVDQFIDIEYDGD